MECGKMFMVAGALMFLLLAGLAGHGYALPSTTSSSERTTLKQFSSTQTSSSSFSQIITTTTTTTSSSSSPTTATTTKKQPKPLNKITTTTSTLPPSPTEKITKAAEEHGTVGRSEDDSSGNTKTIVIVCCCVGGILLLVVLIVGAYYIYRWCLKKRAAKRTRSEPNAQHPDGTSKADFKAKNPHTPQPPVVAVNPWAPEHVPASTFDYKGPLVLQTRPPAEVPMVHELDNEQPPSFHESHHVQFDDTQNVAVEIGSEVEVLMDGEKELPKKARSSLPSPYAQSGGKAGGASGGGKGKKKMSEKQKDKAIRE